MMNVGNGLTLTCANALTSVQPHIVVFEIDSLCGIHPGTFENSCVVNVVNIMGELVSET